MKVERYWLGLQFWSDKLDVRMIRPMNLMYIAFHALCPDDNAPSNRNIALMLKKEGIKSVKIYQDQFQFKAKLFKSINQ
jgi:hypothetical protein